MTTTRGEDGQLHCHCCGASFSEGACMAVSRDATVALGAVGSLLSERNFSDARKLLEDLLAQYVAPAAAATGGSGGGSSGGSSGQGSGRAIGSGGVRGSGSGGVRSGQLARRPLLHPMHTVAFNAHAQLVNCCRSEHDHAGAVRHLKQIVCSIDAVYPENHPEAADFLFAYVPLINE